ncbi:MAG: hypothetical protein QG602_519 [Verrucomicrobiota bacterium]|nr:hypothetical protein [Verrucomicrobiota bacterium]
MILVLLHLSMVATANAAQQTLAISRPASRPYLATFGSPALRFQEAKPVLPPDTKPIASGPPVAASAPEVAEVSLANNQAAASTPPMPLDNPDTESSSEAAAPVMVEPVTPAKESRPPSKALPILPDDTRRKVQSQDFLPLFRFPGSATSPEDVTVITPGVPSPPAPAPLPPSSATYRQY